VNEPAPPLIERLRAWDSAAVSEVIEFRGELTLVVPCEQLRQVGGFLRGQPGLEFDFLSDVSVMDRFPQEPRFELNYQLLSISTRQSLRLRVRLQGSEPLVDTVTQSAGGRVARARGFRPVRRAFCRPPGPAPHSDA
jgi:NADH-quinone oxidoreductase subunit C